MLFSKQLILAKFLSLERRKFFDLSLCISHSHKPSGVHSVLVFEPDASKMSEEGKHMKMHFSPSLRPRCVDAVCLSPRRCIVSRSGDALKRRFSWFPDWIPKVQMCATLVDFEHVAK